MWNDPPQDVAELIAAGDGIETHGRNTMDADYGELLAKAYEKVAPSVKLPKGDSSPAGFEPALPA